MKQVITIILVIISITRFCKSGYSQWLNKNTNTYNHIQRPIYDNKTEFFPNIQIPNDNNSLIYNWQLINTSFNIDVLDMQFLDSAFGWVCGNGFNGSVLKTTNGGINWQLFAFANGSDNIHGIQFLNRDTGWVVGFAGVIRKTTNAGNNWINRDDIFHGSGVNCEAVHFFDENTGVIGGTWENRGIVKRTTNSGINWNQIYLDTNYTTIESGFWFNETGTCWLGGVDILLRSNDSGKTFQNSRTFFPPSENGHYGFYNFHFVNSQTGWIGGSCIEGKNIHKTTDGGNSWTFQINPISQFGLPQINGITFINNDTGWATSLYGVITTTNGGSNWLQDFADGYEFWPVKSFKFRDRYNIWCGSEHGRLWKTSILIPTTVYNISTAIPSDFILSQNYPNPFNPSTVIGYKLSVGGFISLNVYDANGRLIKILESGYKQAGNYSTNFSAERFSSGIYYYSLYADGVLMDTKKSILLK